MTILSFADHTLDIDRRELRRRGQLVPVEPQVFDLVAYLVLNRDRVVTKDELIASVWNGRIVSESTLTSRMNAARKGLGDSGEAQRLIRTYARKGVRFVGEVQVSGRDARSESRDLPVVPPVDAGKPCIAVLPFVNLSGDPEQEYFSDGITEDVIAALSRHRSLMVIARNSTFALKGRSDDVRRIGRDLGAAYIFSGSVRRMGQRMRITTQLVETEEGRQVWGEQYDRVTEELFEVQDEITSSITARLEAEIGRAEQSRVDRKPPQSYNAWDLFRVGTRHFYEWTVAGNSEAQRFFRRAIEVDPTFAEAHGFLSYAIVLSMLYFDAAIDEALLDEAVDIAKKGVMLDERDALVRFMYGRALLGRGQYGEALAELESAVQLNPNLAVVYCGIGDSLAYGGRTDEAILYFEHAVSLSPHDPVRWAFYSYGALAHLIAGAFEKAEQWAQRATRVPNCHYWGYAHRVAALGYLHRDVDLGVALRDLSRMKPNFTCALARERLFYLNDRQQLETYLEGLRRAGVPAR